MSIFVCDNNYIEQIGNGISFGRGRGPPEKDSSSLQCIKWQGKVHISCGRCLQNISHWSALAGCIIVNQNQVCIFAMLLKKAVMLVIIGCYKILILSIIIIWFMVNTKQDIPSMPSEWQGRSHTNRDPKIIPSSQALHCIYASWTLLIVNLKSSIWDFQCRSSLGLLSISFAGKSMQECESYVWSRIHKWWLSEGPSLPFDDALSSLLS